MKVTRRKLLVASAAAVGAAAISPAALEGFSASGQTARHPPAHDAGKDRQ